VVADDWLCDQNSPVTAVAWWGSYIGYRYQPCQDLSTLPPVEPDYFLLTIWDGVPTDSWDPNTLRHPGRIVWKYEAANYDQVLVGYDKHPEQNTAPPREPVFRYSVRLPREAWFCQKPANRVYWFSVVAVYAQNQPSHSWGWTNHAHTFGGDAVAGVLDPAGPVYAWIWEELYDQTGASEDMSFILYTDPDPKLCTCWDPGECDGQTLGDASCDGAVNFVDLGMVKAAFFTCKGHPDYNCCADFNHDGCVSFLDLGIIKQHFFTGGYSPATGEQRCPP
jgi:hypothetical protein